MLWYWGAEEGRKDLVVYSNTPVVHRGSRSNWGQVVSSEQSGFFYELYPSASLLPARGQEGKDEKAEGLITHKRDGKEETAASGEGALAATKELLATAKEPYRSLGGGSEDEGGDAAGDNGDDDDDDSEYWRRISVGLEYPHDSTSLFHSLSHSSWLAKHVVRPHPPTPGTSLTMSGRRYGGGRGEGSGEPPSSNRKGSDTLAYACLCSPEGRKPIGQIRKYNSRIGTQKVTNRDHDGVGATGMRVWITASCVRDGPHDERTTVRAASSSHYAPLMLLRPLDALPPTAHHLGQKETRTGYHVSEEDAGQPKGRKDGASVAARGGGGGEGVYASLKRTWSRVEQAGELNVSDDRAILVVRRPSTPSTQHYLPSPSPPLSLLRVGRSEIGHHPARAQRDPRPLKREEVRRAGMVTGNKDLENGWVVDMIQRRPASAVA
ncbi:hypothetical protein B0H14DRAFT_3157866 [Mycena olivaceomarginata]|nr:hypothetical protein B0H14DRAFT_3157866 [Mycena olivaceomarginata]